REAKLALPLLTHPSADLRARAAAVAGNDASLAQQLLPLTHDSSECVRLSAQLALLNAPDLPVARAALLSLIRARLLELTHRALDFPVDRLMSPEVAAAVIDWSEDEEMSLASLQRFYDCFREDDLRSIVPRLLAEPNDTAGEVPRVFLLARSNTDPADALLGEI